MSLLLIILSVFAQDKDEANRDAAAATRAIPDWSVSPYSAPDTALEILCAKQVGGANDCLTIHLAGAASGGAMFRYNRDPDWFGQVRASGEFRYGLLSGGYGLEGRVGTFWGLDRDLWRVTVGPDVYANLYQGLDYVLEPGVGVALTARVVLKPAETFWIHASAAPGVQLLEPRRGTNLLGISVMDDLAYRVGAQLQGVANVGAGYVWRRNSGGLQHGFYLSGAF